MKLLSRHTQMNRRSRCNVLLWSVKVSLDSIPIYNLLNMNTCLPVDPSIALRRKVSQISPKFLLGKELRSGGAGVFKHAFPTRRSYSQTTEKRPHALSTWYAACSEDVPFATREPRKSLLRDGSPILSPILFQISASTTPSASRSLIVGVTEHIRPCFLPVRKRVPASPSKSFGSVYRASSSTRAHSRGILTPVAASTLGRMLPPAGRDPISPK